MTKSRQSAIKLRLSRLVRCLLFLGCVKLAIMGVAVLELPMPAWFGATPVTDKEPEANESVTGKEQVAGAKIIAPAQNQVSAPEEAQTTAQAATEAVKETAANMELPVGSAAAELAAAAKPRRMRPGESTILPAPLLPAGPGSLSRIQGGDYVAPLLPGPAPLGAPLAKAGVILPTPAARPVAEKESNLWDMLDLKSLPIPGLGSAQAAHAAALDMPVPQTPAPQSPFTPAEQIAPVAGQPTVLPGAPPLPDNIPRGQGVDGAPLKPRYDNVGGYGSPHGFDAPAPKVTPGASSLDPNLKTQELARQQQDILMLRQQMDQRLKDLQSAEEKMKDMLREAKDIEDKKVRSLIQMYANMKPRMAAQAMEKMDERIAVRILAGMAPKQSGEILTYTDPAKTAKFTEMITRLRMME